MLVSQPGAAGAAASGCQGRLDNDCWLLVLVLDARRSDTLQDVGKAHAGALRADNRCVLLADECVHSQIGRLREKTGLGSGAIRVGRSLLETIWDRPH